jgi:hypothetical protein
MKLNEGSRTDWSAPLRRPKQTKWADPIGGPGPIPLRPAERLVKITACITREDRDKLLALGDGNISLGVHVAINSTWLEDDKE